MSGCELTRLEPPPGVHDVDVPLLLTLELDFVRIVRLEVVFEIVCISGILPERDLNSASRAFEFNTISNNSMKRP